MNTIYINSSERSSGDIQNFSVEVPHMAGKIKMRISSLSLPFVFSQVNSGFSTISWTMVRGLTYNGSFTIKSGNYNIYSLLDVLKADLTASILTVSGITVVLNFSYDKDYFGCTCEFKSEPTATTITFGNERMSKMLGFTTTQVSFTNLAGAVSDSVVNVNPINAIFLRSNLRVNCYQVLDGIARATDILLKIPLLSTSGTIINYGSPEELELFDENIDMLELKFTDEWGNILPLLLDYTLVLKFMVEPLQTKPLFQDHKDDDVYKRGMEYLLNQEKHKNQIAMEQDEKDVLEYEKSREEKKIKKLERQLEEYKASKNKNK